MSAAAILLGLGLPIAVAWGSLGPLAGADAVGIAAMLAASAALNSFWPLGGGMSAEDAYATRFLTRDYVFDARRSARERFLGPFTMTLSAFGCFFLALPPLGLGWRLAQPSGLERELSAVAALLALVVVGLVRHKRELPLWKWREELEAGREPDASGWKKRVEAIARIARPDGSLGHVGGIGAATVGLHEHLDALEILERAAKAGVAGAGELLEKGKQHLESRRVAGGFPVYPGSAPRAELTERAELLLRRK
ncbi:MAG: hypothetical protein QM765_22310 [Myxococcales bacterium]